MLGSHSLVFASARRVACSDPSKTHTCTCILPVCAITMPVPVPTLICFQWCQTGMIQRHVGHTKGSHVGGGSRRASTCCQNFLRCGKKWTSFPSSQRACFNNLSDVPVHLDFSGYHVARCLHLFSLARSKLANTSPSSKCAIFSPWC